MVAADQVNCCDYYERGAGYEFSVCDGNIGAVIRQSLIGGERDAFWASQSPDSFLGPVWTDLSNLVNNYCDQRQSASAANSSSNGTSTNVTQTWQQLDLPWGQWKNDVALSFDNLWVWLGRYQEYLNQAEAALNGGQPSSNQTAGGNSSSSSNSTSNTSMPSNSSSSGNTVDFSGISYGTIVTQYNTLYAEFINWYNVFFGQDGLVSFNRSVVYDGVVPVETW